MLQDVYRYFLLKVGIPELARERIKTLFNSCNLYGHVTGLQMYLRVIGTEDEYENSISGRFSSKERAIYFKLRRWIRKFVPSFQHGVTIREAMSCIKSIFEVPDIGPRTFVDFYNELLKINSDTAFELSQLNEDERQEIVVAEPDFYQVIFQCLDTRRARIFEANRVLFTEAPSNLKLESKVPEDKVEGIHANLMILVSSLKTLLHFFMEIDPARSGIISTQELSIILMKYLKPTSVTKSITSAESVVLNEVIQRYRDKEDGNFSYLDFWAMLYRESFREEKELDLNDIGRMVHSNKMGLDTPQRHALLVYIAYCGTSEGLVPSHEKVDVPRDRCKTIHDLVNIGETELRLTGTLIPGDGPGSLTVTKPPKKEHDFRDKIPVLGYQKDGSTFHQSDDSHIVYFYGDDDEKSAQIEQPETNSEYLNTSSTTKLTKLKKTH